MSAVALRGISKRFGDAPAVQGLDLDVASGEFVALLGPSGCGKSTTLRIIAALEQPDEGRIEIADRDVTALPPSARGVAMVFQNYALFPHLTVAENIVFGLTVRRVERAERERRLARAAGLLGLEALLSRKPAQLSGGQRQLRQQMRSEIRELQQRLGMTMVYVTHDQTEAMTMADRVVLMRAGRVEQHGTPQALYEQPASTFVAGFIGAPAMNLFDAALAPAVLRGAATDDTLIGVRPEQLQFGAQGEGLPAKVATVEYLGAESLVVCEAGTGEHATRLVVRSPGGSLPRRGEAVGLRWPPAAQHAFNRASGRRIPSTHEETTR